MVVDLDTPKPGETAPDRWAAEHAGRYIAETIKHLETFLTGPLTHNTAVLPFSTTPTGSTRGGAA